MALLGVIGLGLLGSGNVGGVLFGLALVAVAGLYIANLIAAPAKERAKQARWHRDQQERAERWRESLPETVAARAPDPLEAVRALNAGSRGGVYLGVTADFREWTTAPYEQAVLVIGPPRSGKTSALIIPTILAAPGPVVSTSTKSDVLAATAPSRSRYGRIWLFDPSGTDAVPEGVVEVHWSPIRSARTWDGARTVADAMAGASSAGSGVQDATHWVESSKMLLAPLLHAAALVGAPMSQVVSWVNRTNLVPAGAVLKAAGATTAVDQLAAVAKTEDRERSSIFSTTRVILAAYGSDAVAARSGHQNFDVDAFVRSSDSLFITAPSHLQSMLAPLVVGLLDEIREAAFRLVRDRGPRRAGPVLWALDELANIAPLRKLPSVVSEAGGQGLQIMACFQDLSQARARWGPAADGFLTLFTTKVVFAGVGDRATLDALATMSGDWDRPYSAFNTSTGTSVQYGPGLGGRSRADNAGWTYTTQREPQVTAAEIANIPPGHAMVVRMDQHQGNRWHLVQATPHFASQPWRAVTAAAGRRIQGRAGADVLPTAYGSADLRARRDEFMELS